MTVLYLNPCFNEVHYKATTLYMGLHCLWEEGSTFFYIVYQKARS